MKDKAQADGPSASGGCPAFFRRSTIPYVISGPTQFRIRPLEKDYTECVCIIISYAEEQVEQYMGSQKKTQSNILKDHIRVGKVLKPPISQLGPIEETSWVKVTMPELLWVGLILDRHNLRRGVDLSLSLAQTSSDIAGNDKNLWFATTSAYDALTEDEKKEVRRELASSGKLAAILQAIDPLLYFYPECPLGFLADQAGSDLTLADDALEYFKQLLASLYPKRDRLSVLVQTQGVYIALVTQNVFIMEGNILGDLNAVQDYPDTEESLKVGASACAMCNMSIRMTLEQHDAGWAGYFWKRGFELDSCEYQLPYSV